MRLITPGGIEQYKPDKIEYLLGGPGLLWIDVAHWDAVTEDKRVLAVLLGIMLIMSGILLTWTHHKGWW